MSQGNFKKEQGAAFIIMLKVFRSSCRLGKLYKLTVRPWHKITGGDIYYYLLLYLLDPKASKAGDGRVAWSAVASL